MFRGGHRAPEEAAVAAGPEAGPWYDELAANARAHGAYPYVVEGFMEVVEAVRRGHAVLIRRVETEVADGVRVFANPVPSMGTPGSPLAELCSSVDEGVVTILSFDLSTARFELQDASGGGMGAVQLTPKRLQRYMSQPETEVGVALGA